MRAVLLFLLASAVVVTLAQQCANPVFEDPDTWGVDGKLKLNKLSFPAAPVPFPSGATACRYFASQSSCCSNDTLAAIEDSFTVAKDALAKAEKEINDDDFISNLLQAMQALVPVSPGVSSYINSMNDLRKKLITDQLACVETLVAYTEGMACFACTKDYMNYINDATKVFNLAQGTCAGIAESCKAVYQDVNALIATSASIVTQWIPSMQSTINNLPDMCGGTYSNPGDCAAYICSNWLSGVEIPKYVWKAHSVAKAAKNAADKTASDVHISAQKFDGKNLQAATKEILLQVHNALVAHVPTLYLHDRRASTLRPQASSSVAATSKNVYVSGGYDALAVGCTDSVCPNYSADDRAWIAPVVTVSVLAALTAAYFMYRKYNPKEESGEFVPLSDGNQVMMHGATH